jgi:hypothetical protein
MFKVVDNIRGKIALIPLKLPLSTMEMRLSHLEVLVTNMTT